MNKDAIAKDQGVESPIIVDNTIEKKVIAKEKQRCTAKPVRYAEKPSVRGIT